MGLKKEDTKDSTFIDTISGVYNEAFFLESGKSILQLAKRNNSPLSVCVIDIDDLEKINDTYGHDIGNKVIEAIAQKIRDNCRKSDLVGYFGEGKIGLVLYDASGINTKIMLDTLRQKIQRNTDFLKKEKLSVTVSIGACIVNPNISTDTLETPRAQAYEAIRSAKSQGKNCVVVY